ncbi:MAG: adenylate/guanylate cyclase domain-containing protein [Burkholderiales bacterium]|nr:adenylate/guanylate cyclase domain-containing protein [Burkholderiales bacterium]
MLDQANRTFICSVVFIDLVGYSKKPVAEQIRLKTSLTNNLSEAIKDIPVNDRIILDTGDGAALSFLGDPEDALFTTLSLREAMVRENQSATQIEEAGEDSVRMGINLGPVKLVKDINGHPNIIGDGINVAQRIMSFARPGQIVVSRSYYDVVSNLASEYAKLFTYEGSRTDKHVREHEIYVVGHNEGALKKAKDSMKDRAATTSTNVKRTASAASPTGTATVTLTIPNFVQDKKKLTVVAGVLAGVVAILGFLVATKKGEPPAVPAPMVASAPAPAAAPATEPVKPAAPVPTAEAPKAAPAAGDGKGEPPKADAAKAEAAKAEAAKAAGPQVHAKAEPPKVEPGKAEAGKPAAPAAPAVPPGTIIFAIQPWGELYVNGKASGVSPPVKSLKLPPGKYKIEVKNTTFAAYSESIDVKARDEITIRHKFQ